jgi:transposase
MTKSSPSPAAIPPGRVNPIAEVGLDMGQFPPPDTWSPGPSCLRAPSNPALRPGRQDRQGQPYLKGALGDAAATVTRIDTFLGERYRRLVKRRGKKKALSPSHVRRRTFHPDHRLAAPGRAIRPLPRPRAGYYASRTDNAKKARNHTRQLQALGYSVSLTRVA